MTEVELSAFEANIVPTCPKHEETHRRDRDYRRCVALETKQSKHFVKFDNPWILGPEFSTQSYIYGYAIVRHRAEPRIPQALRYFKRFEWNLSTS